jgi:hypothetical protein
MAIHYVPAGHGTVSPYLVTREAEKVIELRLRPGLQRRVRACARCRGDVAP